MVEHGSKVEGEGGGRGEDLKGRGWEGRGGSRGGAQNINYCSIIALRCLWKVFLKVFSIFARKLALTARCWQAIADSHTPASGRN